MVRVSSKVSKNNVDNLGEAFQVYMGGLKGEKLESARSGVQKFVRWFGPEKRVVEITPSEIGAFSDEQYASSANPSYVMMQSIKMFLAYLKKSGHVKPSLATHLRIVKGSNAVVSEAKTEKRQINLTGEGLSELQKELSSLQKDKVRLTDDMRRAAADGDFRENSPLDAAREEHDRVSRRIKEIDETLKFAVKIEKDSKGNVVSVGTKIHLRDIKTDKVANYQIVEPDEAAPFKSKISKDSPIGLAVLNRSLGDVVKVSTPSGPRSYKIEQKSSNK